MPSSTSRLTLILFNVIMLTVSPSLAAAQIAGDGVGSPGPSSPWAVFAGVSTVPISVSGMQDIHVSDWETIGLKDQGYPEGRIVLPLAAGNTSGMAFGGRVGATYRLANELDALCDFGLHAGTLKAVTFTVGLDYTLKREADWHVGFVPRIGLVSGTMDFGPAKQLPSYTAPVITQEGTFNDGELVSASVTGFLLGGGAAFTYKFNDQLGLRADLGLQYGVMSGVIVRAGTVDLDQSSPAVVKTDGSDSHAQFSPAGSSVGVAGALALLYQL